MADWHPMLAAHETEPGVWRMLDSLGEEYGLIELRRVQGRGNSEGNSTLRYRCTVAGELLGWATSLRTACARVHQEHLRAMGPGGMGIYGRVYSTAR